MIAKTCHKLLFSIAYGISFVKHHQRKAVMAQITCKDKLGKKHVDYVNSALKRIMDNR